MVQEETSDFPSMEATTDSGEDNQLAYDTESETSEAEEQYGYASKTRIKWKNGRTTIAARSRSPAANQQPSFHNGF